MKKFSAILLACIITAVGSYQLEAKKKNSQNVVVQFEPHELFQNENETITGTYNTKTKDAWLFNASVSKKKSIYEFNNVIAAGPAVRIRGGLTALGTYKDSKKDTIRLYFDPSKQS